MPPIIKPVEVLETIMPAYVRRIGDALEVSLLPQASVQLSSKFYRRLTDSQRERIRLGVFIRCAVGIKIVSFDVDDSKPKRK